MDDQVLIHVLEAACGDDRLIFQVVEQGQRLHIFINRGPEDRLDYPALGKKIYQAFRRLRLGGIEGVCLYSRVLGEEEPDWEAKFRLAKPAAAPVQARPAVLEAAAIAQTPLQRRISEADTYVRREDGEGGAIAPGSEPSPPARTQRRHAQTLPQAPIPAAAAYPLGDEDGAAEAAELYEAAAPTISVMAEPPQPAVGEALAAHGSAHEPAHEPAHEAGADLSNYCFISNRRLLTASLLPPPKALAKLLLDLHGFSGAEQQQLLPRLDLFVKGAPTFSAQGLSEPLQQWFQAAKPQGNEAARKLAIWLSRYCLDPEATLAVAARVLDPSLPNASLPDPSLPDPGQAQAGAAVDGPVPTGTAGAHPISPTAAQTLAEPKLDSSKRSANRSRSKPNRPASQPGPVADGRRPSRRAAAAVPEQRVSVRPGSGGRSPIWLLPSLVVLGSIPMISLGLLWLLSAERLCRTDGAIAVGRCAIPSSPNPSPDPQP